MSFSYELLNFELNLRAYHRYVAETMMNRVLRFFQQPEGVFHGSVFCQLSGGVGPIALAFDTTKGNLYIGCYDTPGAKQIM